MKRLLVSALVVFCLSPSIAWAYDDGGDYGNDNDQRKCYRSENCRGSFSPGPFDRSPVDIHDNQVCISPDCSSHGDDKKSQRVGLACLIPFPYHCDPRR
jgi:hypothetical protein